MIRAQVQLTEEQFRRLHQLSKAKGASVAAIVREALDRALQDDAGGRPRHTAFAAAGRFRSGTSDVSAEHDRYLGDAYLP